MIKYLCKFLYVLFTVIIICVRFLYDFLRENENSYAGFVKNFDIFVLKK